MLLKEPADTVELIVGFKANILYDVLFVELLSVIVGIVLIYGVPNQVLVEVELVAVNADEPCSNKGF